MSLVAIGLLVSLALVDGAGVEGAVLRHARREGLLEARIDGRCDDGRDFFDRCYVVSGVTVTGGRKDLHIAARNKRWR